MPAFRRILIIGGYGRFGGQIARLIDGKVGTTVLIAGRDSRKAAAFCLALRGERAVTDDLKPGGDFKTGDNIKTGIDKAGTDLQPVQLDRDGDVLGQLRILAPDLVIDASGPFQVYGDDPYRVVKACLELGICYMDLADGTDFVAGIDVFDSAAKARGIFVLSGVSSFPALSAAAVEALSGDLSRIDTVWAGIAPSAYAGLGFNVVQAIASYAGKPIALWRDGVLGKAFALTEIRRATIAPPGCRPLTSRHFSLVDASDLQVLRRRWPSLRAVWTGAGPEHLHLPLIAAAWLVRLGLIRSLAPLARPMHLCLNKLRWGEYRSGMIVAMTGVTQKGIAVERAWHLVAEGDAGPLIPAMASAALLGRCDREGRPAAGARAAIDVLSLADFHAYFTAPAIRHGCRETVTEGPLYVRLLGDAWAELPPEIRAVHDLTQPMRLVGKAQIDRGSGLLARLVASLFRFPKAGRDVAVQVDLTPTRRDDAAAPVEEQWQRNFAGRKFASSQELGRGRQEHLIVERFGAFSVELAFVVEAGRLRLIPQRMRLFGCRLPRAWTPYGETYETVIEGQFNFHVEIAHRLTGLVVRYRGWLACVS